MAIVEHAKIRTEDILCLKDRAFNPNNVCLVPCAGSGIGRATAVVAAANGLMAVGLDVNEKKGIQTQQIARSFGGQMIFIRADICRDKQIDHAVAEAAKIGTIRYLANIAPMPRIDDLSQLSFTRGDHLYRLIVRAPFYMAQRVASQIKCYPKGTGIIGNLTWHQTRLFSPGLKGTGTAFLGSSLFNPSILASGEDRIRAFTLNAEITPNGSVGTTLVSRDMRAAENVTAGSAGSGEIGPGHDKASPIDMANLFLFGFSRFARFFSEGRLRFSETAKKK